MMDVVPRGDMLVMKNKDVPGAVGEIGSILGDRGVNIARFYLGRKGTGDEALAVIEIDTCLDENQLEELRAVDSVLTVKQVHL
jgi:D-3-phosphoglycerate dehydrogenase